METPSSFMFGDLRSFGHLTNREAAEELLSATVTYGGKPVRSRIDDRTFLSRQVVHARPGQIHPEFFADFFQSAQTIAGRITDNLGGKAAARALVCDHYRTVAANGMCSVLHSFDLDDTLYANEIARISAVNFRQESDRNVLYVMLFLATGCLADPREAVSVVERFVEYKLAMDISTVEMDSEPIMETPPPHGVFPGCERLGLLRIVSSTARPPIYPLSITERGTIIGSLADGEDVINDVDLDVSRRHLRIWRDGQHWYAEGLNSTNGTTLTPGSDGSTKVIESPRAQRGTLPLPPTELQNGDLLHLGATTTFLVMSITV